MKRRENESDPIHGEMIPIHSMEIAESKQYMPIISEMVSSCLDSSIFNWISFSIFIL
jgi:hypothetical protein